MGGKHEERSGREMLGRRSVSSQQQQGPMHRKASTVSLLVLLLMSLQHRCCHVEASVTESSSGSTGSQLQQQQQPQSPRATPPPPCFHAEVMAAQRGAVAVAAGDSSLPDDHRGEAVQRSYGWGAATGGEEGSLAVDEEEEEEEEEALYMAEPTVSIGSRVPPILKSLRNLDMAKELYLHYLGKKHPFPFCAWQIEFNPKSWTPVLLDTNSLYRLQAIHFTTTKDVYRIRGKFPKVRYFSFQSYDSKGQPLSTLPDYRIQASKGYNPFSVYHEKGGGGGGGSDPISSKAAVASHGVEEEDVGEYEIYITPHGQHEYANELVGLKDVELIETTTILFRLYGTDPSVQGDGSSSSSSSSLAASWGFVDPPVVERLVRGGGESRWKALPLCNQSDMGMVAASFVELERKYLFPLPPDKKICGLFSVDRGESDTLEVAMYPYGHLESGRITRYVVYTNKDSNYLYWCDSITDVGADFIAVLRGLLPLTAQGLHEGRKISHLDEYETRYVSISTVENMPPSDTYRSLSDHDMEAYYTGLHPHGHWDRQYVVVAATDNATFHACQASILRPHDRPPMLLAYQRQGLIPPRLPGLIYREILPRFAVSHQPDGSIAYVNQVCEAGKDKVCRDPAGLRSVSEEVMGDHYPRLEVYQCDRKTGQATRVLMPSKRSKTLMQYQALNKNTR